jgi:hypothetical protein
VLNDGGAFELVAGFLIHQMMYLCHLIPPSLTDDDDDSDDEGSPFMARGFTQDWESSSKSQGFTLVTTKMLPQQENS